MRLRSMLAAVVAAVALEGRASLAQDADRAGWQTQLSAVYVTSDDFRGFGAGVAILKELGRAFALGPSLDVAHASADGYIGPDWFDYSFVSLMLAGTAQLRLPGRVVPYLEVKVGVAGVSTLSDSNTGCSYGTGFGVGGALGLAFAVTDRTAIGVRVSARTPAGSIWCKGQAGAYTFRTLLLYSLGATLDLHW